MKLKVLCSCLAVILLCGGAWGLDEAVLTPTNTTVSAIEDRAFNAATDVWMSHRYSEGKTALLCFGTGPVLTGYVREGAMLRDCFSSRSMGPVRDYAA